MAVIKFEELMQSLKKGEYAPVYLLHGPESFFIDHATEYLINNVLAESERVFNQIICYGREVNSRTITDNARQYPMMSQKRLVVLKEAHQMRDLKLLEHYVTHPAESTILVIAHPHKKVDGRSGFYKAAMRNGVVYEAKALRDYQMPSWITSWLRSRNYKIDPDATQILVDYLGADLGKVVNELEKLMITLGDRKQITRDDVYDNIGISKDFNVFEFQKALGMRDLMTLQRIVLHFTSNMKNNPMVMITSILYGYYSKLFIVKSMGRASDKQLSAAIGGSPYFIKEYKQADANYSLKNLEASIAILKKYDLQSKGVGNRSRGEGEMLREMVQELYTLPQRMR